MPTKAQLTKALHLLAQVIASDRCIAEEPTEEIENDDCDTCTKVGEECIQCWMDMAVKAAKE